jgi:peptidoglycan/LPS O-acetylase OafA/YrhL
LNLPIIAAVFISFFVYEFIGYSNIEAGRVSGSQWLVNFLKPNLTLNQAAYEAFYGVIIDGAANFVPPLWTIKIEFFGSLYVLFYLIAKPKDKFILSLFIVFIFILLNHSKDEAMYILALFSGAFLPVVKNIRRIHALLLFFLGLYFAAFQYDSFFYNFLPTIKFFSLELSERKNIYNFFGAIFMIIAVSNGVASRLLNSNVCALLGRLSYSIYLVHFVVICSFSSCLYLLLPKSFGYLLLNLLFYIVVLIVFASIFERYIDRTSVALSRFLFR